MRGNAFKESGSDSFLSSKLEEFKYLWYEEEMNLIKSLSELKEPKISEVGGKGYSLAILTNNGFNVPQGFVITSKTFFEFLKAMV